MEQNSLWFTEGREPVVIYADGVSDDSDGLTKLLAGTHYAVRWPSLEPWPDGMLVRDTDSATVNDASQEPSQKR